MNLRVFASAFHRKLEKRNKSNLINFTVRPLKYKWRAVQSFNYPGRAARPRAAIPLVRGSEKQGGRGVLKGGARTEKKRKGDEVADGEEGGKGK